MVNNQSPSEYFSCDGGDYFIYDSANETWMTDLHKGGDVSFLIVAYIVNVSSSTGLFGDYDSSVGAGSISGYVDSSGGKFRVRVADGIGLYGIGNAGPDLSSLAPGIIVIGVSHTPGSTTDYIIHINGTNYTATPGGYTPTMANPSQVFGVGTTGVIDGIIAQSSTRIYSFAAWQGGRLTSANFTSIWNAIRGRYGL